MSKRKKNPLKERMNSTLDYYLKQVGAVVRGIGASEV